jgi:hypothetical protein
MPTPIPSSGSLARKAQARVLGVLVLGLLAAVGLGYAGYQLHQLNSALSQYTEAEAQRHTRMQALNLLYEIETAFSRFLLDGNSANIGLMQRDRDTLEQMAQRDPSRNDQVLQNLVAQEKRWYSQVAQPLIDQRRNLPAGQGLSEDFLARYRSSGTGLELLNPDLINQTTSTDASRQLMEAERKLTIWFSVGYIAAAILLILGVCVLGWGAFKRIAGLRRLPGNP